MDQKLIDRAVKVAQRWNVFRPVIETGFSPAQIKEAIIGVLDPYFLNKDLLEEYSIELQVARLKLGNVVNELHDTLSMPDLIVPPPWGIRLNQWRNIAQHHWSCVRGNLIYGYYGEPPNEQEVRFKRSELLDALRKIYAICEAVSTSRSLFVIDNI